MGRRAEGQMKTMALKGEADLPIGRGVRWCSEMLKDHTITGHIKNIS
jgi:hypothetical protein